MNPPSPWIRLLTWLLGLLVGLGLAWLFAGPERADLARELPGVLNTDGLQALYLHDQVHRALARGDLWLFDPRELVPAGLAIPAINGGNVLEMLLSDLLRLWVPYPAWLSCSALAWIPLNLLAFLPLGLHLWKRPLPALAGAAAWAAMPPVLGQISTLRLTQVVLIGVPIAVLGLLRLAEEGGRKSAWIAGAGLALTAWGYWFYAVFLIFCAPLFVAWGLRRRPARALVRDGLEAAGVALLLISPLLVIVLKGRWFGDWSPGEAGDPGSMSPIFPDAIQLSGAQVSHVRGWLPPVLVAGAFVGLMRGERRLLWAGATLLCIAFALGPAQQVGGIRWLLPSYPFWRWMPGLGEMRHPERWWQVGALFAVVLSVDGFARMGRGVLLAALVPVGVAWHAFQVGQAPLQQWSPQPPAVWQSLIEAPAERGVIALPIGRSAETIAWAPLHGRILFGGMVENQPWYLPTRWTAFLQQHPLLLGLWALGSGHDLELPVYQRDLDDLAAVGLGVVVVDLGIWNRSREAQQIPVLARLQAALGPAVHTDPSGAWWRLPAHGRPGDPPDLGLTFTLNGPPGPDPKASRR